MDKYINVLKTLSESAGISGYESAIAQEIIDLFHNYTDEIRKDKLGNIIALKKGANQKKALKILLAAHMDEIGFMVSKIDKGFLRVSPIGGIDTRTVVNQEVIIHGREKTYGVFGSFPPHLSSNDEISKGITLEKLFIDTGLTEEIVKKKISVGDLVSINRDFSQLAGDVVAGKALDDRAGLIALYFCMEELNKIFHDFDVYFVATVQEEVGTRGALVSTFGVNPDIGIAIDVCHGNLPGVPQQETSNLGKGAVITWGPNIHPKIYEKLKQTAEEYNIPFQEDVDPGPTGTDARAIQITKDGIPTGLISIPLRYMHTSVELLNMKDVKSAGRLLAYFIKSLDNSFKEELLCY